MHILHMYKTYYDEAPGGVAQVIRQLGTRHVALGHRVSVLTLSPQVRTHTQQEMEGITVHKFPLDIEVASNGVSLAAFRGFRALANTAEVLHYHFPWPTGDVLHQFAPRHLPTLLSYHSDIVRQRVLKLAYAPLMRRFLSQMDRIVATSPNYIATSPVLQRYATKTTAIPIGLEEALYPAPDAAQVDALRQRYGDYFLFVGALRYYKDIPTLIEAARINGLAVVIAGGGKIRAELEARAAGLANIHFLGAVDDAEKMALLHGCRGFVFPSHVRSEAFGISLLEAAMVGKPLISCAIGSGMSFINPNGVTGIEIPPQNAAALARAMQDIADDDTLAERYGSAARDRFREHFTAEKMAADYLALYTQLIR